MPWGPLPSVPRSWLVSPLIVPTFNRVGSVGEEIGSILRGKDR